MKEKKKKKTDSGNASGIIAKQLIAFSITAVIFVVAAVLFLTMPVSEQEVDVAVYRGVKLRNDGDYWTVVSTTKASRKTIEIPSVYEGKSVEKIERLTGNETVEQIIIPESIRRIASDSFDALDTLKSIIVVNTNRNYRSADGILVSGDGTEIIKAPESYDFGGKLFVVPEKVETIGAKAFKNCRITAVAFPDSVKILGDGAFSGCGKLTEVAGMEKSSLIALGRGCFENCESLMKASIPASVINIGAKCFYNCKALSSIIVDEDNGSYRSEEGMLVSTDGERFIACAAGDRREVLTLPEGVKSLAEGAFSANGYVVRLDLPSTMESVRFNAFYDCEALTGIVLGSENPPSVQADVGEAVPTVSFFVKEESVKLYEESENWKGVRVLPSRFSGNIAWITVEELREYEVGRYLELIDCGARLTDAVAAAYFGRGVAKIPDSVESELLTAGGDEVRIVGSMKYAFSPVRVTEIVFGGEYLYIGGDFNGYADIRRVVLGKNVKRIGEKAFSDCTGLVSVSFDGADGDGFGNLEFIGKNAFSGCTSLESAELPALANDKETIISPGCFGNCPKLSLVILHGRINYTSRIRRVADSDILTLVVPDELEDFYSEVQHYAMWGVIRGSTLLTASEYKSEGRKSPPQPVEENKENLTEEL